LTDEFREKRWTKRGINYGLAVEKLQDTGTDDRWPGIGRLGSARTEETLRQLMI